MRNCCQVHRPRSASNLHLFPPLVIKVEQPFVTLRNIPGQDYDVNVASGLSCRVINRQRLYTKRTEVVIFLG